MRLKPAGTVYCCIRGFNRILMIKITVRDKNQRLLIKEFNLQIKVHQLPLTLVNG